MPLKNANEGKLNIDTVAKEVLRVLSNGFQIPDLGYAEHPNRLMGGFDTLIYAFRISGGSKDLTGPKVVRVFAENKDGNQVVREATFQNAVANSGLPVPKVMYIEGKAKIGSRPFIVMDRAPGRSMMDLLTENMRAAPRFLVLLAQTHTELHSVSVEEIRHYLEEFGISSEGFSIEGDFGQIERYISDPRFSHIEPGFAWIKENLPEQRNHLSICHGDFHPGNLIVESGEVTGILDWPGARIAEAELDIATTLLLMEVLAPLLAEDSPSEVFKTLAGGYLQAYTVHRAIDSDRLNYYKAFRALKAFVRGTAGRMQNLEAALAPRDQYPWADDRALTKLSAIFKDASGIELPISIGAPIA